MAQPGLTWYEVQAIEGELGPKPDFGDNAPTQPAVATQWGAGSSSTFVVLAQETLPFLILTDEEVEAKGVDPNRTISGVT